MDARGEVVGERSIVLSTVEKGVMMMMMMMMMRSRNATTGRRKNVTHCNKKIVTQ